jgi:hypothetical protein
MRKLPTRAVWIGTLLVLLGLACRLAWVAGRTETGVQSIGGHWRDATWGWVAGKRVPIANQDPADQAEFWLREAESVLADHPDDAELAMGAPMVLDAPGPNYAVRYLEPIESVPGIGIFPTFDQAGLKRAEDEFEARCRERCLALAAQGTECEPDNLAWWRLRAILLQRHSMHSYDRLPRDSRWQEVLEEAARHDPDNALYDYLTAKYLWDESSRLDVIGTRQQLVVTDMERFDQGTRSFERGQSKRYFAVGDAGFTAAARFLEEGAIPRVDQFDIVNSRNIQPRRALLLRDLWRCQSGRADNAIAAGDIGLAARLGRESNHLMDQYTIADSANAFDPAAISLGETAATRLRSLVDEHRVSFSAEEASDALAREEDARLNKLVREEAGREMARVRPKQAADTWANDLWLALQAVVVSFSPSLAVVLLVVGGAGLAVSRVLGYRTVPGIGPLAHAMLLAAALAATIVVFGLAPARIIPEAVQQWTLTTLAIAAPLAFAAWIVWKWRGRQSVQFSLRSLFITVGVVSILLAIAVNSAVFSQLPFHLSIPARGFDELSAASAKNLLGALASSIWVLLQWSAYEGPCLTIGLWAMFVALWLRFRPRQTGTPGAGSYREGLGAWTRQIGRASLVLSALCLATYLALAPSIVLQVEQNFQEKMAFARNPDEHWRRADLALQAVQNNARRVAELRDQVQSEMTAARAEP